MITCAVWSVWNLPTNGTKSVQGELPLHKVPFKMVPLLLTACESAFSMDNRPSSGLMIASFQMVMDILTPLPGFFFPFTNRKLQFTRPKKIFFQKLCAEYLSIPPTNWHVNYPLSAPLLGSDHLLIVAVNCSQQSLHSLALWQQAQGSKTNQLPSISICLGYHKKTERKGVKGTTVEEN